MRSSNLAATAALTVLLSFPALPAGAAPAPEGAPLTLDEALRRTRAASPLLRAGELDVHAREALVDQAGRLPNPVLELEAENVAGSGPLAGTGSAEWTLSVSQPVPLGGRRRAEVLLASLERDLAAVEREAATLDAVAATSAAFWRVLVAQDRVALSRELLDLARRFEETVAARVEAGRAAPVASTRARIQVARARTRLARARRELAAARSALAANWGAAAPGFGEVRATVPPPSPVPPWERLAPFLDSVPAARRAELEIRRAEAAARLERARIVPGMDVRVGRREFAETGDRAWVASVGLPLPVFDRRRDARRAALLDTARTRALAEGIRARLAAELQAARQRLAAATAELVSLREEVVPAAEEAFSLVEIGYREGKFGFLDVLDVQRDLASARELLLEALEEYLLARVDLERRLGRPLSTLAGGGARREEGEPIGGDR